MASLRGVRDARQLGTITACEIGGGSGYLAETGPALSAHFRDRDLLVRPMGNTVYVMPPYCIEEPDLDAIYIAIAEAAERFG
jgi:adenosylmethionine-8-amino-7-oxononanoate aminotransferase